MADESSESLLKEHKPYYSSSFSDSRSLKQTEGDGRSIRIGRYIQEKKPDGGWGWMVVLGVALSNMTTQSLISVFGLLFLQRLADLHITTSGASIIVGVQTTSLNFSGLVIGPIIKRFSYRKTAAFGGFLVVSGLLLTMFANSLLKFVFSYSLFTGVGLGLLNPSTFVGIDSYFSERKGRAVSLSVTGTGVGQMLLPFLVESLLEEYGFDGTVLILAGLALHSILGATLYQPVRWHTKKSRVLREECTGEENAANKKCLKDDDSTITQSGSLHKFLRSMDLDLMTNPSFVNLIVCIGLVYVSNICFSMLLPFFLESIGFPKARVALCMSVLSCADIIGRLSVPIFTDGFKMKSKTVFFIGAGLSALVRSALVWHENFAVTLFIVSCCGMMRSLLICNFNLSISEQTSSEKLPSALGLQMLFKGFAIVTFAPVIGYVRDSTGSYDFSLHILSIFFLGLPFSSWLLEFFYTKKKRRVQVSSS